MDDQNPHIEPPDRTAAGLESVFSAVKYAASQGAMRSIKSLAIVNKKGGFDCPSCAWPDPDGERSIAEFCENGAKAVAWEATSRRATPEFFARHSVEELNSHDEQWLGDQGRITHPMVLRKGSRHYETIGWPEAFKLLADELNGLDSPDEALFYTSGRTSNEAAFLYQLFVRQFGTNNLPDCSNMCHESSGLGLSQSIGIGKGTVKLSDFEKADSIFIIGQNPGTNHPRMLSVLETAVRNGCRIVSINPLAETGLVRFKHPQHPLDLLGEGTALASLFLPVRINGDVAVLKGIMKLMLENGALDHDFIEDKTLGFDLFQNDLRNTSWEEVEQSSGLRRGVLQHAAEIASTSKRMITCWAMGITQHKNAVANVQTIVNFHLLRGQIGREGAGLCPVRGHSNVQGDRTMGIWERMTTHFREALSKEFNFTPPAKDGYDAVAGLHAMHDGRIKVFLGMGGNLLSAGPDTEFTSRAFRRLRLSAYVTTKLNRNHLITGQQALLLPCLGRTERDLQQTGEQFVTTENSMGVVQSSQGTLTPASEHLLSEPAIICHLAHATLRERTSVDWLALGANYDKIRDHISRVIPGFEDYNRRVREPGGFYLPNPPRDACEFRTATGKGNFFVHPIPRHDLAPGQLLMMSIRSHDQFNTTIYAQNDRYRGITGGRRVIFLNRDDIKALGLAEGQWVDITSHYEGTQRRVEGFKIVGYDIPRSCAATYYPETNPLVPLRHVADGSNQPASKSVVITLTPSTAPH